MWHELHPPRCPGPEETRLLAELAAFVDEPLLHEQVRTALVTAVCGCGCSSVALRTDAPAIPPQRVAQLSGTGRDDVLAVRSRALGHVDVVLHVASGRVLELEVFDTRGGEGVAVPLESITGLQDLSIS